MIVDTLESIATSHSMKLHTVGHPTSHWPQRIEMREGFHHVNMLARLRSTQNAIDRRSASSKKTISISLLLLLLSRLGLLILIARLRSTRLRRGRLFTQCRTHRHTKVFKILVRIDKILHQMSPRARAVRVGKIFRSNQLTTSRSMHRTTISNTQHKGNIRTAITPITRNMLFSHVRVSLMNFRHIQLRQQIMDVAVAFPVDKVTDISAEIQRKKQLPHRWSF